MNKVTVKSQEIKPLNELKVGQLYSREDEVYILSNLYDGNYALVCLNDGVAWDHLSNTIEGAFSEAKGEFQLITNDKVELEAV